MMFGFGGGSSFYMISMIVDKVFMIVSRYGSLLLKLFISFVLSSYLYFITEFNFQSLIDYKLFSRPELVVKYFYAYLKNYYHHRSSLPLSETGKILLILVTPYLCIKLITIGFSFLLFMIAIKLQKKMPVFSQYILRKVNLNPTIMNHIVNKKDTRSVSGNPQNVEQMNRNAGNNKQHNTNNVNNNRINLRK